MIVEEGEYTIKLGKPRAFETYRDHGLQIPRPTPPSLRRPEV